MKQYYVVLVALLCFSSLYAQDCGCDHFISSDDYFFDGSSVLPGQVVCFEEGVRESIKIKNLIGTESFPILLKNCGGQVLFDVGGSSYAITIDNSRYFKLSGTGSDDVENGISIISSPVNGIVIRNLSTNFELDHLNIEHAKGTAILIRDNPNCDLTANEGFFTLKDVAIHDVLISNCGSGIQIGNPAFRVGMLHPFCGLLFPYEVIDFNISNSKIVNIVEGNAIAVYGCSGEIKDNYVAQIAGVGVLMYNECHVKLERNQIKKTGSYGAYARGGGEHLFYSNLFIDNGAVGTGAVWIEFKNLVGDVYENKFHFLHNTVVNSGRYSLGVQAAGSASSICLVKNNILCEPTSMGDEAFELAPYYCGAPNPLIQLSNNLISDSRYDLGFVDPDEDDFRITSASSAINYGSVGFLDEDFDHQFRNLAGAPDAGAFEYVPEPLAYFEQLKLVGLYVDDFKNILGNYLAETALLEYAKLNGFNYLLLYNLSYIHTHDFDLTEPDEAIVLASFIKRAKSEYGIVQVGAVGEKDASFDKIQTFNELFGDSWFQKIDVLNLELEFWTDPGTAVFEYYCENYFAPSGFPCNSTGAFNFYSEQLELIDARAHEMGIISEIYLGYPTDAQSINLSERCDRILLHHYRTSDTYGDGTSIYNYHPYRIQAIALSERKPAVMPIFSSRAYHMGPWLVSHSLHQPMDTWLNGVAGFYDDESEGVGELKIAGFQWYRYTSFPDVMDAFYAPETSPEFDSPNESEIQTSYNSQNKQLTIVQASDLADEAGVCEIYSVSGALVLTNNWLGASQTIDLSSLPTGIYFLCLKNDQGLHFSQKISHL